MKMPKQIKLSIVTPVYNEEQNIGLFHSKVTKVLKKLRKSYEIWFIDDGSRDSTLKTIKELKKKDKRVKFITFRRNFGKAAALSAGFEHANGDIIITMDGDLQDEPEEIPKFIAKIEEGYDLVNGWKFKRKDPLSKTIPSKFFNWLTSKMIGVKLHDFNCGFKAYRKEVVKEITLYGDLHRYIPAIAFWKGYRIAELPVKHNERLYGKSKYGSKRILTGFIDLMTVKYLISYTTKPLQLFGKVGLLFIFLSTDFRNLSCYRMVSRYWHWKKTTSYPFGAYDSCWNTIPLDRASWRNDNKQHGTAAEKLQHQGIKRLRKIKRWTTS